MQFYNPNKGVKSTGPEGFVGENAVLYLPFCCWWSPSGKQYSFASGEIPQSPSRPVQGYTRPNDFVKNAPSCPIGWGPV